MKCEETFFKYLIIAFYEEGSGEPSMIMQIEKFNFSNIQNTKAIWLEYLKIVENSEENEIKFLSDTLFNAQNLKKLYPKVDENILTDIFSYIFQYKEEYGIDNCTKLTHFLTQADHESGGFRYLKEIQTFNGNREKYKGRGIFQVTWKENYESFQKHLVTKGINIDLLKNPELLEQTKYAVISALWFWQKNNLSSFAVDLKISTALKISKLVNCGNINYCGCEKDESKMCKKDQKGSTIKCYDCAPNGWDDRKIKFEKYKVQLNCQ